MAKGYKKTKKKKKSDGRSQALNLGESEADSEVLAAFMPVPPLIEGESKADYIAFRESCLRAVGPKDAIEKIWIQDFIDYSWEANRLRRMKVALIQATQISALEDLLIQYVEKKHLGGSSIWKIAKPIAKAWSRSEDAAIKLVEALFEMHDLNLDTIIATAMSIKIQDLERIDKLIASYNYRKDAAIRELDKRRDILAKRALQFTEATITDVKVEKLEADG